MLLMPLYRFGSGFVFLSLISIVPSLAADDVDIQVVQRISQQLEKYSQQLSDEKGEFATAAQVAAATDPRIAGFGHTSSPLTPGNSTSISVLAWNSNDVPANNLVASVFFSPAGNFVDESDMVRAVTSRQADWPLVSTKSFTIQPKSFSDWQTIEFTVPDGVPNGAYIGNWILWQRQSFGQGKFLGRACFQQVLK